MIGLVSQSDSIYSQRALSIRHPDVLPSMQEQYVKGCLESLQWLVGGEGTYGGGDLNVNVVSLLWPNHALQL